MSGHGGYRWKRYPEYRQSGVEWLGDIPAHWDATRLKWAVCKIGSGKTPRGGGEVYLESGVMFLRSQNVHFDGLRLDDVVFIDGDTDREMASTRVQSGDVLLNITGASLGRCSLVPKGFEGANVNQHVCILRPRLTMMEPGFLHACLASPTVQRQIFSSENGVSREGLNYTQTANLVIAASPSLHEQQAIAAFLDRKTAKLDALIAKNERLIELLQEKRAALISHAVTKGLDPAVPMKNSDVEWLGKIPKHWDATRIKWVAKLESGHTPDKKVEAYWTDCDIPWVSLNDTTYLKDHDYITDTAYRVNPLGLANSSARLLPARAVVFSRDATIGRCSITTVPMAVSQHFIAWLCSPRIMPEYLLHVLRSMTQELERLTMGATLKTIGMPDVKTLAMPVPPVDEQKRIVKHIELRVPKLDALIARVRQGIDLLREYRTALISAAVTGKIDVRQEVP